MRLLGACAHAYTHTSHQYMPESMSFYSLFPDSGKVLDPAKYVLGSIQDLSRINPVDAQNCSLALT